MAGRKKEDRPFRIFDEGARLDVPHRAYVSLDRAVDKALTILFRLEVGNSYTVYNSDGYKGIVQFTRRIDGIQVFAENPSFHTQLQSQQQQQRTKRGNGT